MWRRCRARPAGLFGMHFWPGPVVRAAVGSALARRFAIWCTKTRDVRKPSSLSEAAKRTDRWGYNLAVCRNIPATWAFLRDGSGRGGVVPSTVSHVEDFCAKNANPVCRPLPSGGRCIEEGVLRPCIEVPWKRAFCECVSTIWRGARADAVLCLGACSMASAFRHSRKPRYRGSGAAQAFDGWGRS